AFLFCGPRGPGRTSTARILAKMLNCEQGPTAGPCGVCVQCVAVREGQHLDVVEIDAASHGGVEDARELRERAPTAPAMGREKVYIIDEAQRLSREAFDALLKIFEEPPPGVRFVLATTEPHKMPPTIVGRCQRFDFRRVSTDALSDHLEWVAKQEGLVLARPAAEADMRWTTSPRLTLELALVRATMPEADPNPAGLLARLERLERLAGVDEGTVRAPEAGVVTARGQPPPNPTLRDDASHHADS